MMSWYLAGLVLVGTILLLMGIRVPVAFAFLAAKPILYPPNPN